ncbi:class I SAM-dependent methyltransferase, partial [Pelagibacteraceae bacterium]|nr:class I SAM-dependent methyltransferase [Pelagibacteraceae bacterium]
FLNEYVYSETQEEIKIINKISERVKRGINNKKFNDLEILILSCYAPLYSFSWSERIKPSISLLEIFELQLYNYNEEKKQFSGIKSIADIKDTVSIKVKNQYEENPYPRWTNLGLSIRPRNIKDVIRDMNLNLDLNKVSFSNNPEILIAGCGTGQHAITTASKYENIKIFALDLSFNSLAYAKRKAKELNLTNINFIQGDLLDLKKINKKFDIIESVGVLHHMNDPLMGWKSINECLKDTSILLIGLYSEKARENITEIRKNIKSLKIKTTRNDIINFRKDIFETKNTQLDSIKYSPDFYSTSGVRDLLFHVQEHTFTIPKIKKYIRELNLFFLGFEDTYVIERYKKKYDQPLDLYDLDKWEDFEQSNPRIFSGMYQFWCMKNTT